MSDDHDTEGRPEYDPTDPAPPSREPPLRSTAPQSDYTIEQVGTGVAIAAVSLLVTFGLPLVLA